MGEWKIGILEVHSIIVVSDMIGKPVEIIERCVGLAADPVVSERKIEYILRSLGINRVTPEWMSHSSSTLKDLSLSTQMTPSSRLPSNAARR